MENIVPQRLRRETGKTRRQVMNFDYSTKATYNRQLQPPDKKRAGGPG
jgi:hypothetical protein